MWWLMVLEMLFLIKALLHLWKIYSILFPQVNTCGGRWNLSCHILTSHILLGLMNGIMFGLLAYTNWVILGVLITVLQVYIYLK